MTPTPANPKYTDNAPLKASFEIPQWAARMAWSSLVGAGWIVVAVIMRFC